MRHEEGAGTEDEVSPGTRMQADPAALDQLAEWLLTAQQPVILAGYLGRHKPSFYRLVELAEATGAAVVDLHNRLNFPTTHPLNISAAATGVLSAADLVLALDVKDLYGPLTRLDRVARRTEYITPRTCRIAEIGFRDLSISKWSDEFQQLVPVDLQIIADTAAALPDLVSTGPQPAGLGPPGADPGQGADRSHHPGPRRGLATLAGGGPQ